MAADPPAGYAPFDLYPSNPNEVAGYIFVALFAGAALIHIILMFPYRVWFPLPMVLGCCFEAGGYFMRSQSHDELRKVAPFVVQHLLIMAAPPLLAAPMFMAPRRMADALDSKHFLASPRLLPKLFILVDIVCLITQSAGAIMSGSEDLNERSQGELSLKIGLIVQLVAIVSFIVWLGCFHHRLRKSHFDSELVARLSWQRVMWGLYTICFLFVLRTVTRLIEYGQGSDGPMLTNEVYLYILDATVMWVITILFAALHPGRLNRQTRQFSTKLPQDGPRDSHSQLSMEEAHAGLLK